MNRPFRFVIFEFVDLERVVGRHFQATQVGLPGKDAMAAFFLRGEAVLGIAGIDRELGSITQSCSEDPKNRRLRRFWLIERRGVGLVRRRAFG